MAGVCGVYRLADHPDFEEVKAPIPEGERVEEDARGKSKIMRLLKHNEVTHVPTLMGLSGLYDTLIVRGYTGMFSGDEVGNMGDDFGLGKVIRCEYKNSNITHENRAVFRRVDKGRDEL